MPDGETICVTDYFGGCPECGRNDGTLNIRREHWCFCDDHELRWIIGSNLFSSWREETEADWRRNCEKLMGYAIAREVIPEGTWPADPAARQLAIQALRGANASIEFETFSGAQSAPRAIFSRRKSNGARRSRLSWGPVSGCA